MQIRTMKTLTMTTLILTLALAAVPASAVWDPLENSRAFTAASQDLSLTCAPDGGGDVLSAALDVSGAVSDATITVELIDLDFDPIAGFPAEDIWLETSGGGLVLCDGGARPDGPTDAAGVTVFSGAIRAGGARGHGEPGALEVWTVIDRVPSFLDRIALNSADLNGDLVVDLSDVIRFAELWPPHVYDYAVDFHHDGQVNLADLIVFAGHLNTVCP